MIYLERLRDDPFLLDAFESNVAEWASLLDESSRIEVSSPLMNSDGFPDELKLYHDIAERWPQFDFRRGGRGGSLITEVETFEKEQNGEWVEYRKFQSEECVCCFLAVRFDPKRSEWLVLDVIDNEVRREVPFKIDEFLVSEGLKSLSNLPFRYERGELEAHDFKWLQDESMMIWEIDEYTDCWFHSRGILGFTLINEAGEVEGRRITACSRDLGQEVINETYRLQK